MGETAALNKPVREIDQDSELFIAPPVESDWELFVNSIARSRELHAAWVSPPTTREEFYAYLDRLAGADREGFLVRLRESFAIVGVIDLSHIVHGDFCSCFLSYYALEPFARRGLMKRGLRLVIDEAFGRLQLHRVEANIQPENRASIGLVRSLGFRKEGFSPRYLRIGGKWRDHERWALTVEDQTDARPREA